MIHAPTRWSRHYILWISVVAIVAVNAILLIRYHSLLEGPVADGIVHKHLFQSQPGTQQQQQHRHAVDGNAKHNKHRGEAQRHAQQQQAVVTNGKQEKPHKKYNPVTADDRFAIPEISSNSSSPWGRLLALHKIRIVYTPETADNTAGDDDASLDNAANNNSTIGDGTNATAGMNMRRQKQLADEQKKKQQEADNDESELGIAFDEDKFDAADLLLQKLVPIRFWRLDPLVPEAALMTKSEINRQNNRYVAMLHHVKHQASVLRFRWPWHLGKKYESWMREWVESRDERDRVFKRVAMKVAPPRVSSIFSSRVLDLMRPGEIMSDMLAAEVEQLVASDFKLPLFARRVLVSRLRAHKIFRNTGCNVLRIPFTSPSEDDSCVAYLSNLSNWKRLRPLPTRYDARTIKFQVEFNEPDLHSVLKVPQRLFPYEAFAEIGAYHADRVLGVRRIPPTAYVCIPKEMIRETVKREGHTVETDDETLKDSGVKTYEEWVEKDLLNFAQKSAYNADDHGDCVGSSIQPYMADVHHLLDSVLAIPYKTHDASWQKYFNFSLAIESKFGPYGEEPQADDLPIRFARAPYVGTLLHMAELTVFDFIVGNNDRSPNKNAFVVGSCVDDVSVCSEDETAFFAQQRNDEIVVTAAGGNDGSKMKHNNGNKADVGGGAEKKSVEQQIKVDWKLDKTALRRSGAPTFVHLDQGMAFYQTPSNNALTKSLKEKDKAGFCVFRRRLVNRILDLVGAEREPVDDAQAVAEGGALSPTTTTISSSSHHDDTTAIRVAIRNMIQRFAIDDESGRSNVEGGFAKLMEQRIPKRAMHSAVLTRETFAGCEKRMRKVLLQLSRCLAMFPIEKVIAP